MHPPRLNSPHRRQDCRWCSE